MPITVGSLNRGRLADKFRGERQQFGSGCLQVVIDQNALKLGSVEQLEFRFGEALFQHLWAFGAAADEAFAENLQRWRLDEDAQAGFRELLFDGKRAFDVDVYKRYPAAVP